MDLPKKDVYSGEYSNESADGGQNGARHNQP